MNKDNQDSMTININAIYVSKTFIDADPFSQHKIFVKIVDVRKNNNNEEWIKYNFLIKDNDGNLIDPKGGIDATDSLSGFSKRYSLYKNDESSQDTNIENPISQLEI